MSPPPTLHLLPGQDRRLRTGHPWVFANEVRMDEAARGLEPGSLVQLVDARDQFVAWAHANPHSLIVARVLTRQRQATVDEAFLHRRLARALQVRERLYAGTPYYRLVHAEADFLPGLVVDRFGDVLAVQLNTAGMTRLEAPLLAALDALLAPRAVVLRNDSPARELEGLEPEVRVAKGAVEPPVEVDENGLTFLADPIEGQKTGWYYDQADNRAFAARLARDQRVLDLYSYSGAFALAALRGGAREALAIDRSERSLELAVASAERNGLAESLRTERAEAFAAIDALSGDRQRFGVVVADPPSFVRSKRELNQGLRGYRKLARGAAALVAEGGFLAIACCSHHVSAAAFADEVRRGLRDAARPARLLHEAGAAPDHPTHPALPESAYLKCLVYALD